MKDGNLSFIKELETLLNKHEICITFSFHPGCAFSLTSFDNMQVLEDDKICDKKLTSIKLCKKNNLDDHYYYKIKVQDGLAKGN